MILSFHPCFEGDRYILFAGREPNLEDLKAIKKADAVILPQGCRASLYQMAREYCSHVFPNYDAKITYKDKIGQSALFQKHKVPCPDTRTYENLDRFYNRFGRTPDFNGFTYPFVFKFNWGGEGHTVFLIKSNEEFQNILQKATVFEKTGQSGFLIQAYIPNRNRTLRAVVIHRKIITYWRVQKDTSVFGSGLSKGAVIDQDSDPIQQNRAARATGDFCQKTRINLAGFDFLMSPDSSTPLFLEINYFFGRQGLGGSENFYKLLVEQINKWIDSI